VVEHDLPLVRAVADRVVAMDRGRVLADGPPGTVLTAPDVVAAYIGDDERATHRSGPRAVGTTATPRPAVTT
jgi:ABC-type hemin transport system ATPase subunit